VDQARSLPHQHLPRNYNQITMHQVPCRHGANLSACYVHNAPRLRLNRSRSRVKTSELPGVPPKIIDVQTISWMPATLKIRPYRPWVQEGKNLDLDTTIDEVLRHRERISLWGPYETWHGLHQRSAMQKAFLDAGMIGYQCTDQFGEAARTGKGSNCFHAISDMDPLFDRRQYPVLFYGDAAARNIVGQLFRRPILIHGYQTHDWLLPALGLDCHQIVRRQYHGPAKEFSPEAVREEFANPTPTRGPRARKRLRP